jgi:hypothetical protein
VHVVAAAASTESFGAWAYLAVFALMVLSFAGVPAIGAAVVGWGAEVTVGRPAGDFGASRYRRAGERRSPYPG